MQVVWYDYINPKYGKKFHFIVYERNFVVSIKTDDISKDIAEDFESRFDTSNYELDRPLSKRKNKKVIRLLKNELGGIIMTNLLD